MAAVTEDRLVHDAFVYSSEAEFLAGTLPFITDGVGRGDPVLAAPTQANGELLRHELGDLAENVDWAEDPESHRTVERLEIFLQYVADQLQQDARCIRLLGEPCWPADGGAGVVEWKRYESFLNVALTEYPVWLVCPYDETRLSPDVLDDARRTHPNFGLGEGRSASAGYTAPLDFARRLDTAPLPRPPADATERYLNTISAVRSLVAEEAKAAGLAWAPRCETRSWPPARSPRTSSSTRRRSPGSGRGPLKRPSSAKSTTRASGSTIRSPGTGCPMRARPRAGAYRSCDD